MAGARPKFTRETVDRLLEAIRFGMPYHLAAESAGIVDLTIVDSHVSDDYLPPVVHRECE